MDHSKIKVLVADDDALLLRAYSNALSEAGFDVLAVSSGEAALSELASQSFDVVVTDILMHGNVSGVTIAGRGILDYPHTKIIVVTGMTGLAQSTVGRVGLPGAHATLFKPIELSMLIETIESVLKS